MTVDFLKQAREFYKSKDIGRKVGFGEKAAIVVVDFQKGFTDTECPLGYDYTSQVTKTRELLDLGRTKGVPVFFTGSSYHPTLIDAGMWYKKMNVQQHMIEGTKWTELDDRLGRQDDEKYILKNYASAFFSTSLNSMLVANHIDTIIVTGCVTSGCIRATVVDAVSYGYRVIVPRQCVGDRHPIPHEANLFDIDSKYGDVVDVQEVIQYLKSL